MTAATGTAPAEVAAWMDAAVAGDRAAFGRLYERYHPVILRFVQHRVGNARVAEDITADTFLKALVRIGTFTWQGRDPGAWFVTIARNLVADRFKSGQYRLEITAEDVGEHAANLADLDIRVDPELATVRHLVAVETLTAVQSLTGEQRRCVELRFLRGLSVAETARTMGKHEGAIKALQHRALRSAAAALRAAAQPGPAPERPIGRPVIPRPRLPVDEAAPPPAPEPEVVRRILWRCRDCATVCDHPRPSHGTPPCGGWLEPVDPRWQPCPA